MNLDAFNQFDLLALVEDALEEREAAALRDRLREQPGAREMIDRMRADRAALRADPMPALDEDLVAELEPLVARAMLLERDPPTAGEDEFAALLDPRAYRRRHQRSHMHRAGRLAVAACLVIGGGAGGIALWNTFVATPVSDADTQLAGGGTLDVAVDEDAMRVAVNDETPAAANRRGPLHHWDAVEIEGGSAFASAAESRDDGEIDAAAAARFALKSGAPAIESGFALDVRGVERRAALGRLSRMVDDMYTASLVRNFTMEEAAAAWDAAAAAENDRREIARLRRMASLDGGAAGLSQRDRRALERTSRSIDIVLGEFIAGLDTYEAPPMQQITFVEGGASHAITLPAEYLFAFLETLNETYGEAVSLRRLDNPNVRDEAAAGETDSRRAAPLTSWERWQTWRQAIDSFTFIEDAEGDLMIVMPVMVD